MFGKCFSFNNKGQLTTDYPLVYSAHVGLHPHTAADTQWNAVWHRVCTLAELQPQFHFHLVPWFRRASNESDEATVWSPVAG
jgi:hypothetical protein